MAGEPDIFDPPTYPNVPGNELVPGNVYLVQIQDCCAEGTLYGEFIAYTYSAGNEPNGWHFSFGTLGPAWGSFKFWEKETS
jgi:hypothetical protein